MEGHSDAVLPFCSVSGYCGRGGASTFATFLISSAPDDQTSVPQEVSSAEPAPVSDEQMQNYKSRAVKELHGSDANFAYELRNLTQEEFLRSQVSAPIIRHGWKSRHYFSRRGKAPDSQITVTQMTHVTG